MKKRHKPEKLKRETNATKKKSTFPMRRAKARKISHSDARRAK
jgi:hypothetical protein